MRKRASDYAVIVGWGLVILYLCSPLLGLVYLLLVATDRPGLEARDTIERIAHLNGYRIEGPVASVEGEPDSFGGCTIRFSFHDGSHPSCGRIEIVVRRSWFLGSWYGVDIQQKSEANPLVPVPIPN